MRRFGVVAAGTFPQKAKNKRVKQYTAPTDNQRPQGQQQHKRGNAHHIFDQHITAPLGLFLSDILVLKKKIGHRFGKVFHAVRPPC